MINFQLEKVIRCAQMSVDCLRASKLVTLGYMTSIISTWLDGQLISVARSRVNISDTVLLCVNLSFQLMEFIAVDESKDDKLK